jgi:hypothetical protein
VEFRIAQITDDPHGVLTGAFVFSPPPVLPDVPRVLVERFDGENTRLGPHGWAVDSKGLRPRLIEKRGAELWLCFGAEVSFHVLPNTPVRITIPGTETEGIEIWPPIPRGKAPPALGPNDDDDWPPLGAPAKPAPPPKAEEPPPPKPEARPEPQPEPKPQPIEDATVIVAPTPVDPPPPPPPPPPGPDPDTDTERKPVLAIVLVMLVLLLAGGGAAWWFLRPQPAPVEQAATPPAPVPAPAPASPDCAEAADVLSGRCTNDKLRALPPAEQTRLADALLRQGDARGLALLNLAASAHNHPPARLALGRLYDPIHFRPGGPLSAANPERALAEYGRAAEAGLTEAATARAALVARLREIAAGTDATAAEQARAALAAAGIQ